MKTRLDLIFRLTRPSVTLVPSRRLRLTEFIPRGQHHKLISNSPHSKPNTHHNTAVMASEAMDVEKEIASNDGSQKKVCDLSLCFMEFEFHFLNWARPLNSTPYARLHSLQ